MKSLAVYLKEYKKESILAPLFKLLEVVFDLLVPVVVAQIIDVGVAQDNRSYVAQMFFVLILMAGVGLACSFTAQFFAAKASCGFAAKLRQAMFDHIQSLSFTELDTMGTDTLITRLTDDVNQVQNGLNLGLRLLLRSPFVVLGSMVMAFTINVKCAWIFVIAIPVLFVVVFSIMLVSIPLFKKVQNGLDQVTGLTRENLTGVRVIRAFCREEQSVEEFEDSSRELTRLNLFVGRISALLNPVTYVLINIATVILIDRAGIQVNMGNMQQGEVVALYNYMLQIIVELIKLASLIITLNKSMACADRVAGILAVKSSMIYVNDEMRQKEKKQNHTPAVKFDHVTFTYAGAGAPSLKDISFQAMPGETIGIIGGTGSGKSTLVSLIPRFYDPQDGQVYMDGANMNAQVGLTNPGYIGADVCHLNLHKTFAIPHGGGGPGVGPICVAAHLAEFLPGHSLAETGGRSGITAVAAAPFGSALILPITYGYIKMLGESGLRRATEMAIVNANYLAAALKDEFGIVYTGETGRVGHEMILDLRDFRKLYGVECADIARRLMDYGFHAPTLSFPVHETLMIEPTESESLAELDRFVESLVAIKRECEQIRDGEADAEDNPVKMAPHTAQEACADTWTHPYGRERAVFPLPWIRANKFFPYVTKIDGGYGDRNLCCTCGTLYGGE